MNSIEKLMSIFENIKNELEKNRIIINMEIDYNEIERFINDFNDNVFALLSVSKFKNIMKLSTDDEKELLGLIKILNAFKDNDALLLTENIENEIRNKNSVVGILVKLKSSLKEYKDYLEANKKYEHEIIKLDSIVKSLNNKSNIDYIENIDEIYEYLYSKNNMDLKEKFEIYKLIGEYNITVGKKKIDMFTKTDNLEKEIKIDKIEEKVEVNKKTVSNIDSLKTLFSSYNYDIEKMNKQMVEILLKTSVENVSDVLEVFNKIGLRFNESLKSSEKYLMIIARSDKEVLNSIENICNENNLEILDLLKKCPTVAMKKGSSSKTSNSSKNKQAYFPYYLGSYEDFIANIETIKELGYEIKKAMKECITIFAYPHKSLIENIKALEIYGISVKDSKGTFKLSGLKNKDVLFTIDQFIELDELPYVTYNTSRFSLMSNDTIFYRLYKIKKYNLENPFNQIEYKRYKENGYEFVGMITQDKLGNRIVDRMSDKQKATDTIIPVVFDEETTQRLKTLIEEKKTYFSKKSKNNDLVKYLDLRFKSPQSEITYVIGGKIFSRIKVMRLLSILENENLDKNDLMIFCITYNSIISEDEFERVKNAICGLERGKKNE